jgi:ATP-dependent helicase/nuclease subunit B
MGAMQFINPHFYDDTLHILPTFLRVEEEIESLLDKSENEVVFGRKIVTFPQLFDLIYEEIPTAQIVLSLPGQRILIERILDALYRDKPDGYFTPLINSKSLSKTLINIFNNLKSYNINDKEFSDLVNRSASGNHKKLGEVARVYSHYQMALTESGLADGNDINWTVKDFVADHKNEISFLKGVHHLIIEDIYDFTPVQFDLIVALAQRIKHTTVIIPYDHDRSDIFGFVERTIKKFESLWELNRDINLDFKPQRGNPHTVVSKIAERYLQNSSQTISEPLGISDEVMVIESAGIYREAETLGKEIRKLLDSGVKPSTIGLLFEDLSLYGEILEDVFRRFKIPLYFRRGKPLLSSSVAKTILSLFELLDTNFERDTFLKIVRSNYVDCWGSLHPLIREKVEWYLLRAGIIDDRDNSWEGKLSRLVEKTSGTKVQGPSDKTHNDVQVLTESEMVRHCREWILWLKGEIEVLKGEKTLDHFCRTLKRLIRVLGVQKGIMCCDDENILKRDTAALKKIEQILDAIPVLAKRLAMHDESVPYTYFRSLLLKFMEESFILAGRESDHGVKVLNLYESRGLAFDYLFLGGCAEETSSVKRCEDPIFTDEDKVQFNHFAGKKIFLLKDEAWEEEPLLFYLGLSCSRKKLYLSYSHIDLQGRTVLPSFYLLELKRLLDSDADAVLQSDRGLVIPPLSECCEKAELINCLTLSLWRQGKDNPAGGRNSPTEEEVLVPALFNHVIAQEQFRNTFEKIFYCAEIEKRRERFFLEENAVRRKATANAWTGMISQKTLLKELRDFFMGEEGRVWSPTYFENYVVCPFRFFLERVLNVYPLKVPEEEIERVDEGILIHAVLERFFTLLKKDNRLPLRGSKNEMKLIHSIAEAVYEEWETKGVIGNKALWELCKRKAAPLWDRFIEEEGQYHEEGLMPTYFEWLIGSSSESEGKTFMPFLLFSDDDNAEIAVRGKVDRIDIGAQRVRVIDYKNSSSEWHYRSLLKKESMGTVNFQIPIYLAAAREHLSQQYPFTSLEGTYYLFRKAKRVKPFVIKDTDPFFEKDLVKRKKLNQQGQENIFNQMASIVRAAKSGDFSICPQDCSFCQYSHVCRFVAIEIKETTESEN